MWKRTLSRGSLGLLLGVTAMTTIPFSANAQAKIEKLPKNCRYLKEVATNQTHIRKSINSIIGNNFDTDFAVPTGIRFKSYRATMVPENDGTYGITVNLKYSDNSVSTALRRDIALRNRNPYTLTFKSPTARQPYQINLNINGNNRNTYTISVAACQ